MNPKKTFYNEIKTSMTLSLDKFEETSLRVSAFFLQFFMPLQKDYIMNEYYRLLTLF